MSKVFVSAFLIGIFLAGSARAQERQWQLDAAGTDAYLVFGVPETDDVGLSLWCKIGSGTIKLFFPEGSASLKPDTKADFKVTIGDHTYTLQGTTSANLMTGATSIETEVKAGDALIADLSKADRFSTDIGGHALTFPLIEADLQGLIKLCRPS